VANPVDSVSFAAAGIYKTGTHIGLLHRADGKSVNFLHLCDNRILKNDATAPSSMTVWIDPDGDPIKLEAVAGWCRLIYRLHGNGTMPYGFSSPEAFFQDDGRVRKDRVGLTCATLVLAIFHQVGIRIIDYSTWPKLNAKDKRDRAEFAKHIRATDPAQYCRLETDATKSRYKPIHVAGAISADAGRRPVRFRSAIQLGGRVRKML
jgi:hypothetical protein